MNFANPVSSLAGAEMRPDLKSKPNPGPAPKPRAESVDDITPVDLAKVADLPVLSADGQSRPFKELYLSKGAGSQSYRTLFVFVRHFYCGVCQDYLQSLSSSITPQTLDGPSSSLTHPTRIIIIGCGDPSLIPWYAETTSCPYPMYAEPKGQLYEALGMIRTLSLGDKKPDYSPGSFAGTTLRSMKNMVLNGFKGGNFSQVGGEMLVEVGAEASDFSADAKVTHNINSQEQPHQNASTETNDEACVVWIHRMESTRDHTEIPELRKVIGLDA